MSATVMPARRSSASTARDGSSSASRSGRSSQPAPPTPITGAMTRPLTGMPFLQRGQRGRQHQHQLRSRCPRFAL